MGYRGHVVELPLGHGGLIGEKISGQAPADTLLQATNVSFESGAIAKEGGAVTYTLSPLPYAFIEAGWDWWPDQDHQSQVVVASDGANAVLMRDHGDRVFITMATGLLGQAVPVFVEGGAESPGRPKKLFLFAKNVASPVITGNADVTTLIGGVPLDPPGPCVPIDTGLVGAGNVNQGTFQYVITFATAGGETTAGVLSNPVYQPQSGGGVIKLQLIPIGGPGTTARKVFRSQIGGGGPYKRVTTIADNTTFEFYDTLAQASLSADEPPTLNTTNGRPVEWTGTSWPSCGCIHEGRLWTDGPDGHRVYYSTPTDHENFLSVGAGSLSIFPGEGQKIVGMLSYGSLLVIWKYPKGIYLVDTSSVVISEWRVDRQTTSFGGVNPATQVMIDNDIVFLDSNGDIQLLSAVQEFTNMGGQSLSKAAQIDQLIRDYADAFGLFWARMVYYARKKEVHIALRTQGSHVNNVRLVYDNNRPDRPRFRVSNRDICQSLWIGTQRNPPYNQMRLVAGDNAGQIWILDEAQKHKNGAGYDARFQTMHTDLSFADPALATKDKNAQFLELAINPTGRWPIDLAVYWDGRIANSGTVLASDPEGTYLGTWILGSQVLAQSSAVVIRRMRLTGGGRRISVEFANSTAGQDFSIARAFLSFTTAAERTR